jgi:hypothetical protein
MEYISREAVNDLIEDIRNNHFILMSDRVTLALLKSKVAEIPTADVQPVKRGKWEYIRNVKLSGTIKLCECNQCHNKIFGGLNYCGNCGAKMDGEQND